jgi:hypothetical protein
VAFLFCGKIYLSIFASNIKKKVDMEKTKIEKCNQLSDEKEMLSRMNNVEGEMITISFCGERIRIKNHSPLHSRILALVSERLVRVEKELEDL